MDISEWMPLVFSCVSLAVVLWELRLGRRSRTRQAQLELHAGTQALLFKVLDDSELLDLMGSGSEGNQKHRRFWQLWFNHIEITYRQRGLFEASHWQATLNDIRGFMSIAAMSEHWTNHRNGYAEDFRRFIDDEVLKEKAELHISKAPLIHS